MVATHIGLIRIDVENVGMGPSKTREFSKRMYKDELEDVQSI